MDKAIKKFRNRRAILHTRTREKIETEKDTRSTKGNMKINCMKYILPLSIRSSCAKIPQSKSTQKHFFLYRFQALKIAIICIETQ